MNQYQQPPAPQTQDYYDILGISRDASQDDIKRAYRRMALRHHPDKATGLDAVEKFQVIVKSYEVLSDEKKRKIYDAYGERGIQMFEGMGGYSTLFDPDLLLFLNWIFFMLSLFVLLLLLFPTFISIRADNIVNWNWTVVFIPAFIIDAILVIIIRPGSQANVDPEMPEERPKSSLISRLFQLSYAANFVIFQILIALRLDNIIASSWGLIFLPWWIIESFHFFITFQKFLATVAMGSLVAIVVPLDDTEEPERETRSLTPREMIFAAVDAFNAWILRLLQAILIAVKLNGADISWASVFTPSYLYGVLQLAKLLYGFLLLRKQDGPLQQQQDRRARLYMSTFTFTLIGILFYTLIGLLVERLNSSTGLPLASVILIPIFIVLSILFCCVCCCLPCLASGMKSGFDEELRNGGAASTFPLIVVDSNHRVGWV